MPEGGSGDVVRIPAELERLVPGYLERRRAEVREMREAAANGDLRALEQFGHALMGTGGGYGFEKLTELGRDLERCAGEGELEECVRLVDAVADYLDRVEVVYE